jgi:triosephosphate isomerase
MRKQKIDVHLIEIKNLYEQGYCMKQDHYIFVANWKMALDFDESIAFATKHYDDLCLLAQACSRTIVLCPSFVALYPLNTIFKDSSIALGGQDCSHCSKGPFTGQISATCLKSLGCSYCIAGHSERRMHNGETDEIIAQKCIQLIQQEISPVLCIGETAEEYQQGKTLSVLEKQVSSFLEALHNQNLSSYILPICIAYEPVWSIGTGDVPGKEHLEIVFHWIHSYILKAIPMLSWRILYGGSVKSDNVKFLKQIQHLQGFLVGGSSLDFQEFKKIVEYTTEV